MDYNTIGKDKLTRHPKFIFRYKMITSLFDGLHQMFSRIADLIAPKDNQAAKISFLKNAIENSSNIVTFLLQCFI